MADSLKLSTTEELFPDKAKDLEKEDKKINYGQMFQIGPEKRKKIVETIKGCVDESKRQREQWLNIRKESVNNYEGIRRCIGPWEGSSNLSTMVTTISCDLIHSKLFPMVWNPELIYWKGVTKHSDDVAENNKIFSQWFLTKDMTDTQDKIDEIVSRLIIDGTVAVKKVWEKKFVYITRLMPVSFDAKGEIQYDIVYDKVKRERAKWEIKDIEHVFLPYNAKNEDDAPYIIEEIFYTLPMLKEMKIRKLILDDIDMDDVKHAIEKKYDPEGGEKARLGAAGIETYIAQIESTPIRCYEACLLYDINDDGIQEECIFLILPDLDIYLSGKPLHVVSRISKRPWKIGRFLPRPGIVYGKSIPELVRHLHNELDAIHNQRIDAGNMVIAPFFFYRAASGFDPKTIDVKPATGIHLDDPQRDVYFPDYNPSRLSVSFQEESLVMDLIQKLTYVTPAMMGRESASRPTARGTMAIIAQSDQNFNPIAARVLKIIMDLITDTRKMYEEHWSAEYATYILDEKGKQIFNKLSPEMIAGDYLAFSEIDLESSNAAFEKQADQILFQALAQDPYVNQQPAFGWELRANFIKSLGKKNVDKFIGPKPDYEQNPGIVEDENSILMRGMNVEVHPNDDHVAHMNGHQKFKREMASVLRPEEITRLVLHIMDHQMAYTQKLQEMQLMQQQQGGGNAFGEGQAANAGSLTAPSMANLQGPRVGPGGNGGAQSASPISQGAAVG